jgi:predicted Zn-dependent peptidase
MRCITPDKALYKHNPLRDSVTGTVESIAQITADHALQAAHSVFYTPSNMVLCVAGDVDPEKVVAIARRVLPKDRGEVPQRNYGPAETQTPETRKTEKKMDVSITIFLIGAKATPAENGCDYMRQELVGGLALELLAGHSSPLYLPLYTRGLVNRGFSVAYEAAAGAFYTIAGGESSDPDKVFEAYKAEAMRLSETEIDIGLFERLKKAALGRQIRMLNSFDSICFNYARGYFRGYDAYEAVDVLNSVTSEDVRMFIKKSLAPDLMALSVIHPCQTA